MTKDLLFLSFSFISLLTQTRDKKSGWFSVCAAHFIRLQDYTNTVFKLSQIIYFTARGSYLIYRPWGYFLWKMHGWMDGCYREVCVCFDQKERERRRERASLSVCCAALCLCMTSLHSVKSHKVEIKRQGWQIKLTTSSHTRSTFFRWGDWGEITLGALTYNSPHSQAD